MYNHHGLLGRKCRFGLAFATDICCDNQFSITVFGTVIYVNEAHKWFLVEYGKNKNKMGFKFVDLDNEKNNKNFMKKRYTFIA